MPWFRFIGDGARVTLPFRNGQCELTFANLAEDDGWAWVAERKDKPGSRIVLVRRGNVLALRSALMRDGFEVAANSPAARIMLAAVKCGYAEELPDDERWRDELLKARRAARR